MRALLLVALVVVAFSVCHGALAPERLLVEYLSNPLGVDASRPRFSWVVPLSAASSREEGQSAYQILVSLDPSVLRGDIWDSGKMISNQSSNVLFGGSSALLENTRYFWKTKVWTAGYESPFSSIAFFHTGSSLKGAQWIGGSSVLRTVFTNKCASTSSAMLFVSGLGYYELHLNGRRVGDRLLDPGWTTVEKRLLYSTYDVTSQVRSGANAVGVMLGNGWYVHDKKGPQSLLLQLILSCDDGTNQSILSNPSSWKASPTSPILSSDIYDGESYDARNEQIGWDTTDFDDSKWSAATSVTPPKGVLSSQMIPPVTKIVEISPSKITQPQKGVYVFDFDQNFSGWCRLSVKGTAGTKVQLRFAEILKHDGSGMIYTDNLRGAKATDVYVLKGSAEGEVFEPRFTYHGFRYVEWTSSDASFVPQLTSLLGIHLRSSVGQSGSISFGGVDILERIQRAILWGQASNLMSIPTDCDQRDERKGWMADAHLSGEEAIYNFDMAAFYSNWVRDMADEEGSDGSMTDTVPFTWGSRPADPSWGAAYPLFVYWMWKYYGDVNLLADNYDRVKLYELSLEKSVKDSGMGKLFFHYGDWCPPPPYSRTSESLTSAYYFVQHWSQLAEMADALGKKDEAAQMRAQFTKYSAMFWSTWVKSGGAGFADNSQAALSMALHAGAVPKDQIASIVQLLVTAVTQADNHVTTGIVGTKSVMEVLAENGYADLALKLALSKDYPSWGYMITNSIEPATTLWELWDSPVEGPGMNSRNHIMFGSVGSWFYKYLAGIRQRRAGFEKFDINSPVFLSNQTSLASSSSWWMSPRGRVSVIWSHSGDSDLLAVEIPATADAFLHYPKRRSDVTISESGTVVWKDGKYLPGVPGFHKAWDDGNAIVFEVGAGRYKLTG